MKHISFLRTVFFVMTLAGCMGLISCDLEHSDNGKLDGMWHLERMENLETGNVQDLSMSGYYWSFQVRLLQLEDKGQTAKTCLLRFEHTGTQLRIYEPYLYNRETGDEPISDPEVLQPYGINALDETFQIERLSHKYLVLKSSQVQLFFRKN